MKIARFLAKDGRLLHGVVKGSNVAALAGGLFGKLEESGEIFALADVKLQAPLDPCSILCFGRNYKAHAEEGGSDVPTAPLLFIKANSSLAAPDEPIRLPGSLSSQVDFEAELAVVIGRKASKVKESDALSYVLGYACANDVSARDCQFGDGQWARGKSFDSFCPLGPWIETDLNPGNLKVEGRLNGQLMQSSSTSLLIFSVPYLISYLSQGMTLHPGTVILTGTPAGCGFARKPPLWMKSGDVYEVEIEGIGVLRNPVL